MTVTVTQNHYCNLNLNSTRVSKPQLQLQHCSQGFKLHSWLQFRHVKYSHNWGHVTVANTPKTLDVVDRIMVVDRYLKPWLWFWRPKSSSQPSAAIAHNFRNHSQLATRQMIRFQQMTHSLSRETSPLWLLPQTRSFEAGNFLLVGNFPSSLIMLILMLLL